MAIFHFIMNDQIHVSSESLVLIIIPLIDKLQHLDMKDKLSP